MNLPILNRQFQHPADGWYQIEVPGEHLNAGSGVLQVIDAAAVDSIVNRFNQEAAAYEPQHGTPFPGMLVDHEHFKHDPDKETIAYGWLMRMENRDGKPFGQIRWTNTGKPAIDGLEDGRRNMVPVAMRQTAKTTDAIVHTLAPDALVGGSEGGAPEP